MSEDLRDTELAELRAWKAEVLRRNAVPPRAASDEIERLREDIARLTRERDEARSLIPSEGDGACDNCGVIPSHAIPTNLCDHCVDGLSRAEAEAADEARSDLRALADAARRYWKAKEAYGDATSSPYDPDNAPGTRLRAETELRSASDALRSILSRLDVKDGGKCETCGGFERVCRCHGEPPNAVCYELIPCPACKGGKDGAK